jgi:hypothetical protein
MMMTMMMMKLQLRIVASCRFVCTHRCSIGDGVGLVVSVLDSEPGEPGSNLGACTG